MPLTGKAYGRDDRHAQAGKEQSFRQASALLVGLFALSLPFREICRLLLHLMCEHQLQLALTGRRRGSGLQRCQQIERAQREAYPVQLAALFAQVMAGHRVGYAGETPAELHAQPFGQRTVVQMLLLESSSLRVFGAEIGREEKQRVQE